MDGTYSRRAIVDDPKVMKRTVRRTMFAVRLDRAGVNTMM